MIAFSRMIAERPQAQTANRAAHPRIWGLSARELHDAFWHSKGVQCVRRGGRQTLQRAADLYLLIEQDQLAVFDLTNLLDRLTWHNAAVTRLRLVGEDEQTYSEHVVMDDKGCVKRIERRYRPRSAGCWRVMLCSSRRIASMWMTAATRREAWDKVRRSVPWTRVDHCRCPGQCFVDGDARQEREMLTHLVSVWPTPDQAIMNLAKTDSNVSRQLSAEALAGWRLHRLS